MILSNKKFLQNSSLFKNLISLKFLSIEILQNSTYLLQNLNKVLCKIKELSLKIPPFCKIKAKCSKNISLNRNQTTKYSSYLHLPDQVHQSLCELKNHRPHIIRMISVLQTEDLQETHQYSKLIPVQNESKRLTI